MAQVERTVGYELHSMEWAQNALKELPDEATLLLDAQGKHTPSVLAQPWKKLSDAQQEELSDELLGIPKFGGSTEDLVYIAGLAPNSARRVMSAVEGYHDLLPFTKAEHWWLDDMRLDAIANDEAVIADMSAIHWVMAQRGEVKDGGRLRSVSGKDLISREWEWIRGGGEFRASSTYEESRVALEAVVSLFDNP
jgi:hypothetical protein